MGKILAICTSPRRGTLKTPVPSAVLTRVGYCGRCPRRQLAPAGQPAERGKIEAFRQKLWVDYGAFGENLVVEEFDLAALPVPSFLPLGMPCWK